MGSKYLFKLEYNDDKFSTFFVNLYEKNDYNFMDLTNDIKANVRSLQHVTPTTIRIRYKDDDGDFVNLSFGDIEMFKEMFESANHVKDRDYKKIYLKVSQLDSPVLDPLPKSKHAAKINEDDVDKNPNTELPDPIFNESQRRPPMHTAARSKLSSKFIGVTEDQFEDEEAEERYYDTYYDRLEPTQTVPVPAQGVTGLSPLERYMKTLNNNKKEQELKVANLRDELMTVDKNLLQAKSNNEYVQGNVCGNCHLKLGHTAKKCVLDKCTNVYNCGIEKYHPRQTNRSKLRQELQKEESKLQKLKQEIQNRESSVESLKKSLVNQVEQKLLAENASDYYVGGLRNWSLLREHVHLIESYCKRYFNGKIPPKQNLSQILRMAMVDVDEQRENFSQPKRRRVHENPAKDVLEKYGIKFPVGSTISSPSCASSFSNPSSDIWSHCQPKSKAEEEAQLDLVLKASTCDVRPRVKENQSSDVKTEHVSCIDLTHHNATDAADDISEVASSSTEQNSNSSVSNAAIALMSLYNTTSTSNISHGDEI
jgi:hypothetical protein